MERVNLTKFGFIRDKSLDFNDDGNRFSGFRWGEDSSCRLSKCVYNWEAFLSAHIDGELPYEVYSKLPSYNTAVWKYNGISIDELTDDGLKELYEACVSYEKEYRAAEGSIQFPTIEELTEQCEKFQTYVKIELSQVKDGLGKHCIELAEKATKYEWANLQECVKQLQRKIDNYNPKVFPQTLLGKCGSFGFMKSQVSVSFWFCEIRDLFKKYGLQLI